MTMSESENLCGLTFDLDDITLNDARVITTLDWLSDELGKEYIWYRISSSGDGLHVLIAEMVWDEFAGETQLKPIPMSVEKQMEYRGGIEIECNGRRISDSYRKKVGLRTSRIFKIKNGNKTGKWNKWMKE